MSVLIADYTVVVRKRALEEKVRGGVAAYVRGLWALDLKPQFVCDSDPYLVNASFAMPDGASSACMWSKFIGLAPDAPCVPDYAMIVQPPFGQARSSWLEVREESLVLTHAWLKGTEPGELAAPPRWERRRHRMFEHLANLEADPAARAKADAMDIVLDTLRENECAFQQADWYSVSFYAETDRACYSVVIEVRDDGQAVCLCMLDRRHQRSRDAEFDYSWAGAERLSAVHTAPLGVVVRAHETEEYTWYASFEQSGLTATRLGAVIDELLWVADSGLPAEKRAT